MGACVTVHYVISDDAVNKVLGDLAKEHIDTIKEFFKIDGVLDDCGREEFVNDELDWSRDGNGQGLFDDDSYGEEAEAMFKKLCKQRNKIHKEFKKATGLSLYLVYNDPEDHYDSIDGFAWAIDFGSLYQRTPKYKEFVKKYKSEANWSQVVKFG
jgi:hypothetical protein